MHDLALLQDSVDWPLVNDEDYIEFNLNRDLLDATRWGCISLMKQRLLQGANINTRDSLGKTSLHWAAIKGQSAACSFLLNRGANLHLTDDNLMTPLHWASKNGKACVVELLIHYGAKPKAQNAQGWTPLHFAAKHGHPVVIKYLFDAEADPNAASEESETPLHLACTTEHTDIVTTLVNKGAYVHALTAQGYSPLFYAVLHNQADTVDYLAPFHSDAQLQQVNAQLPNTVEITAQAAYRVLQTKIAEFAEAHQLWLTSPSPKRFAHHLRVANISLFGTCRDPSASTALPHDILLKIAEIQLSSEYSAAHRFVTIAQRLSDATYLEDTHESTPHY